MSKTREPAEIIRLREAEKALQSAQSSYSQRVKQAEKQLKQAQKARERAIEGAKSQLQDEEASFEVPLASFEGATLYKMRLDYGGTSLKLDPAMGYEMEVSGGFYSPPEGGNPATDTRKISIHFVAPSGQLTMPVDYDKEAQAHEFAEKVDKAAKDSIRALSEHEKNMEILKRSLQEAQANTHAVDLARESLDQTKASTQSVDAAKAHFETVKSETPQNLLKDYKKEKARKKLIGWSALIIACVVAAALLITWIGGGFN